MLKPNFWGIDKRSYLIDSFIFSFVVGEISIISIPFGNIVIVETQQPAETHIQYYNLPWKRRLRISLWIIQMQSLLVSTITILPKGMNIMDISPTTKENINESIR